MSSGASTDWVMTSNGMVPAPGPGMSTADIRQLHEAIKQRVVEDGRLLVQALAAKR